MPIRVQMPNGSVRPFKDDTPKSVIRKAQADMIADMRASGHYDGCDFREFEAKPKRKVTVTQTTASAAPQSANRMPPGPPRVRAPATAAQQTRQQETRELLGDKRVQALLGVLGEVESGNRYNVRAGARHSIVSTTIPVF